MMPKRSAKAGHRGEMSAQEFQERGDAQRRREDVQAKRVRAYFDLAERAARTGYWRDDLVTRSHYWSPGMYRLLSVTQGEMQPSGDWLLAQLVPEAREEARRAIETAIRTRSPFRYCSQVADPQTPVQYVETQGEVELDENNRVVGLIGVCHDVTEKIIAEQQREKAEQMYRLMTEQASDIILLYAPGGKLLFASKALERILGRTSEEIETSFGKLVHPDDYQTIQAFEGRPPPGKTNRASYRILHKDGHYVWIETTTRGVYSEETGEYTNLISVSRDVTERKTQELEMQAAREHAEAANKAKSRFLANMSHELRTPLNAIIGFTDLMRQKMFGQLGNPRYEEYATLIYDSGQLLLDLISDLLDMSKIEAGKLELNIERVDLAGTVEDCVRLLQDRADNGGLELTAEVPKARPALYADRRALKQILLNLLSNAIKFTPAGGHVAISVGAENGRIQLRVRDDGIGISAADLPRIGKPFEQVVGDPMLAKGGTGLGLSLVRALAEKHGGCMRVASQEGIGTEVIVELPLTPAKRIAA